MYRLLLLIVAICGQWTKAATTERKRAANCLVVHAQQLHGSHCTSQMQHSDPDFKDLTLLLTDAQHQSHSISFISYILETTYQYIHCVSRVEAIARLYYKVTSLPPSTSEWWQRATIYLSSHGRPSHSPEDDVLLRHKIANIANVSSPACAQWLIEHFQDSALHWWRSANPHFPDPNHYTSTTRTSTTTTRATTTTLPTTTSTPKPTTSATPLSTTATTPSKSTSMATTTKVSTNVSSGVSCTVCQDLDCLLAPQVRKCPPHQHFCLITVTDSGHSRNIARGCADKARCDGIHQNALCAQVESGYHSGAVCEFCCSADNCNSPPALVPPQSTRYPQP